LSFLFLLPQKSERDVVEQVELLLKAGEFSFIIKLALLNGRGQSAKGMEGNGKI
jgi:hypothetical protein